MVLLFISSAPVFIILFYIYLRDKYDREPILLLFKILGIGMVIPIIALIVEEIEMAIGQGLGLYGTMKVFYNAFVVAALTEETLKFLVIYLFIWNHKEFNEKFDGIVYATFASLGFALVENIFYVFGGGFSVGIARAITAVPAHAIFGITMGYFFGLAKFALTNTKLLLLVSLGLPVIFHGIYDFILMSENTLLIVIFILYVSVILWLAFRMMKVHSDNSKFNPRNSGIK